jgi:hypothetical protein
LVCSRTPNVRPQHNRPLLLCPLSVLAKTDQTKPISDKWFSYNLLGVKREGWIFKELGRVAKRYTRLTYPDYTVAWRRKSGGALLVL